MAASKAVAKVTKGTAVGAPLDIAAEMERIKAMTGAVAGNQIKTDEKTFTFPDGEVTSDPVELVIVNFTSMNSYYEGKYDPKNIVPPNCFAIHPIVTEMVPSDNSPDKQCETCALCPLNQFGSDGDGKACKNTRRLAVLRPDQPDADIMVLSVSPTALKSFDRYVQALVRTHGKLPAQVITTVSFNESVKYSQLVFSNAVPLDDAAPFIARREEAMDVLSTEPDVSSFAAKPAKPAAKARATRR